MPARNIVTNDHTVVCPEHYKQMRKGCNWRKVTTTYEECEVCLEKRRRCPGIAFCQEIYCAYCSSL